MKHHSQVMSYFCIVIIMASTMIMMSGTAIAADRDVIIGFNKPSGIPEESLIRGHGGIVKKSFHMIPAIAAKVSENKIDEIKKDSRVKYIEDDKIFQATDEYTDSWGVKYIGSRYVHDQGIYGTGVNVSILDTGIDRNHEDLDGNYKGGYDFVYNDADPSDDSDNSHGTHVAGIIAAENNGIGVIGVAPNANIYALKVLDGSGFGSGSDIIAGIEWAVSNNMDIATMSLALFPCTGDCPPGYNEGMQSMSDAIDAAYNTSLLIIAAGGNTNGGRVTFPATLNSVVGVTATDINGQRASFSSIGPEIDIAAPGVDIYSTIRTIKGGYGYKSGTSMATPHVTGLAALIFSSNFDDVNIDGKRDGKDVMIILQNTAFDMGSQGRDDIYGYGLADTSNAILGYSRYVDLSISKSDGISTVVAGDGKIYSYIITAKNNGPSDASDVKIYDTWPDTRSIGLIRTDIKTSQGTCNSETNFTCDLGTIAKNNTVDIIANYTVSTNIFPGDYVNRVNVSSSSQDYILDNNIAEDNNTVEILLKLVKNNSPDNDAKNVSLLPGSYSIIIDNDNLSKLGMIVYDNGVIRKDLSSNYKLNKSNHIVVPLMNVGTVKIVFVPYGNKGSTGRITIRRL